MGSLSQRLERPTDRHQPTDQKAAIMWASPARLLSQVTVTLFLLLVLISDQPVSSSPQPGHLVHDFYKYLHQLLNFLLELRRFLLFPDAAVNSTTTSAVASWSARRRRAEV